MGLNRQLVYETAYRQIKKQGGGSADTEADPPICRYRSSDGKACVIGACIPDELYDPIIEGTIPAPVFDNGYTKTVNDVIDQCPILKGWREDFDWLREFQKVHDHTFREENTDTIFDRLRAFARKYGLVTPVDWSGE